MVSLLTNLRISAKIMLAVALFSLLSIFITAFASVQLNKTSATTRTLVETEAVGVQLAGRIATSQNRIHQLWLQSVIEHDKPDFDKFMERIALENRSIDEDLTRITPIVEASAPEAIETLKAQLEIYRKETSAIPPLWAAGNFDGAEDVLQHEAKPPFQAIDAAASEIVETEGKALNGEATKLEEDASASSWMLITIATIGLILIAGLVLWIVRSQVTGPLAAINAAMVRLAGGDNAIEVAGEDRQDEVGAMARSVLVFRDNAIEQVRLSTAKAEAEAAQKVVVDTLKSSLGAIRDGDLTAHIDAEFAPEYVELKHDFNEALSSLRDLISAVAESAGAIRTGSNEIAQASEDLARRTEANAASLEETTAAVTQMDERLKATASAATSTVARADGAISTVAGGRGIADEAVQAMTRVSESAKGIDSVIEGLDKIAFQTRVLAMNAAVEAGRAGEAGRGFAVVADLVSALAMRAEEEAGRARDQLTATQTDIVAAVDMVQKVGALANISSDVEEVHTLLGAMANDNQAQSSAITEISTAITTMDQSTQQNAAMVEETSAAARNLTSEVSVLAEKAARFRTGQAAQAAPVKVSRPTPAPAATSATYRSPVKALPVAAMAESANSGDDDWASF